MNSPDAQEIVNKMGDKILQSGIIGSILSKAYPKGGDAIAKQQEASQKKKVIGIWHDQMKESNKFQVQLKKEKKIISGYQNKLMKANNEVVTKEYHIYATHPTEFKDCKACRVILNFFKWQKKSITPPKDTYAPGKISPWTTSSGQPTTLLIDDPLIGTPPEHKQLLPWKSQHANICTCKKCEKQGTGSYVKKSKPTFTAIKGSPSFSHYENQIFGIDAVGFDTEIGKAYSGSICTTKSSPGCTEQLCKCEEIIIKWE